MAESVTIAVASNFTAPMKAIVAKFQQSSNHQVKTAFGSSGKIFAQIKRGAPFGLFFSADQAKPITLEKDGLVVAGSRFTYAIGALALWSAKSDFIDANATRLKQLNFNKLALANPKLAPYGAAAVQVLAHLKLKQATEARWVRGENIAQTYQFVHSGNADIGFVALSQVMKKGRLVRGSSWTVPTQYYQPIRQDVVLLKRDANNRAALALLAFVASPSGQQIISSFGYQSLTSASKAVN
jgi:molybdate transport system substrate-binding protein